MSVVDLFGQSLQVINIGLESFAQNLRQERVPVVQMDWRPPAAGAEGVGETPLRIDRKQANREAVDRLLRGLPVLTGVSTAGAVIPGMRKDLFLHAGPPISWERMCGPMRGAVIGGILFEGLAASEEDAEQLAASGAIAFEPCHEHDAVGPMAGVTTWSMPVWVVENRTFGNRAYCTLNEGLGKVLRYGAYAPPVIEHLRWMAEELGPVLALTMERHGPLDLRALIAQALQMGDEGHNRSRAGTSLLIRELAPELVRLKVKRKKLSEVLRFLHSNDHTFLNLSMPSAKCMLDAANGVEGSSMLVTMTRNGTDFGIRLAGLPERWFTAPANLVRGLYFPGYSESDAALDIGDSAITETAGLGGFAMAAAPAIVQFVGGTPQDALRLTQEMYEITLAESQSWQIPNLGFRGTPSGIDLFRVLTSGILPSINTGIAHKDPGVGMIGAGLVQPPWNCFQSAYQAYVQQYAATLSGNGDNQRIKEEKQ
ncbi:MAG: DUF1116 domain-containing protein [Coprothermobacterota bacterium]|nr:DUF1116 domain-containing protein [Coprothermobacterota bacterium]